MGKSSKKCREGLASLTHILCPSFSVDPFFVSFLLLLPFLHTHRSSQTGYMCSKCFKDTAGATRASIEAPAPATPSVGMTITTTTSSNVPVLASTSLAVAPSPLSASSSSSSTPQVLVPATSEGQQQLVDSSSSNNSSMAVEAVAAAPTTDAPTPQKKRTRCAVCNKKVGLTGIECRCDMIFCGMHRYPDQHDCKFDFKAHDRENLKKVVMGGGEFSKIDHL